MPPPATPKRPPPPNQSTPTGNTRTFSVQTGKQAGPQRVVLYGPGGIGKTSLATNMSKLGISPLIVDIEGGSLNLDAQRIAGIETFDELRGVLQNDEITGQFGAIILDSGTKAEELATAHVIRTVRHEKGHKVERLEDYGFGKGYVHVYEAMLLLLADLDQNARAGRHVVMVCHDCTAKVPNPAGDDWIRYEPRLQNSDKSNVRLRVREWCDHLAFVGYDVNAKDGKASGSGTRSIYVAETPTQMAKSRFLSDVIPYRNGDADFWKQVFRK